ncbi:MAG TPA: hypothetical protein VMI06_16650 [Terriglobia bacterium]|nr:hypothetical protein [Terriglobia bacterium]
MLGAHALQPVNSPSMRHVTFGSFLRLSLLALFVGALSIPALAKAPQIAAPSAVEAQVRKFGVGKDVKVTLTGGKKLRGRISSIGESSFTIELRKSKAEREIPYNQAALVKDPGPLVWILVGVAIAVIVIVAVH